VPPPRDKLGLENAERSRTRPWTRRGPRHTKETVRLSAAARGVCQAIVTRLQGTSAKGKRAPRRRVGATDRRMLDGPPARVEPLRRRSPGDGVINTADIERLNATCRERLAPLARRCRALARDTLTLHEGMVLVGTVYHFCTPHASLSQTRKTTPAMAAGITDHCWTMHERLSFHVPLPRGVPPKQRGRPSRALQRLIKRWCS
jgi:hypothetical protein